MAHTAEAVEAMYRLKIRDGSFKMRASCRLLDSLLVCLNAIELEGCRLYHWICRALVKNKESAQYEPNKELLWQARLECYRIFKRLDL